MEAEPGSRPRSCLQKGASRWRLGRRHALVLLSHCDDLLGISSLASCAASGRHIVVVLAPVSLTLLSLAPVLMTMLPKSSRRAVMPGGTTQVQSYSSMTSGPFQVLARWPRDKTGVLIQPCCGPK